VPHCFIYMWRFGVQCRGVDGCPGESHFRRGVMAHPVRVQGRLRGWRRRGHLLEGCPCEDSGVSLTWSRMGHSGRCGGVVSLHISTASDGRTGPTATEVTSSTGPTSRRSPVRAWSNHASSLRGSCSPSWRVRCTGRTGVGGTAPRGGC
jgi:hypothetical protein